MIANFIQKTQLLQDVKVGFFVGFYSKRLLTKMALKTIMKQNANITKGMEFYSKLVPKNSAAGDL